MEILSDFGGKCTNKGHKDHKEQQEPREQPQRLCDELIGANPILCRDLLFGSKNYYYFYTEIKKEKVY